MKPLTVIDIPCKRHDYTPWRVISTPGQRVQDVPGTFFIRRFCKCSKCGHVKVERRIF